MTKKLQHLILFALLICILFCFNSCSMSEGYRQFYAEKFSDYTTDEYFTADDLAFARVGNCVFKPEIKAINSGEYVIYITVYSKTGHEKIAIKDAALKGNNGVFFSRIVKQQILFHKNTDGVFEDCITGGVFTEAHIPLDNGEQMSLELNVQMESNAEQVAETICIPISTVSYWAPTTMV